MTRKIRLHKAARPLLADDQASGSSAQAFNLQLDKHVPEIMAGIADLPIARPALGDAQTEEMRRLYQTQQSMAQAEARELNTVLDMSVPHPLDNAPPPTPWTGEMRPTPRSIKLSPYQYEMINYQRMLMRKNIWYYRDRMNIPRGPCPLHVVKEAWVSGIVDENTLFWGHGLYDWLPAKNIKLLLPMVRTPEGKHSSSSSSSSLRTIEVAGGLRRLGGRVAGTASVHTPPATARRHNDAAVQLTKRGWGLCVGRLRVCVGMGCNRSLLYLMAAARRCSSLLMSEHRIWG